MAKHVYEVVVTRMQPQATMFSVAADTAEEAQRIALGTCGDHVFSADGEAVDTEVLSCTRTSLAGGRA